MPTAHVIGLGKSGVAAARLLKREGWEVEIGDTKTSPDRSEEHTSELQSQFRISYAVFCLKKKKIKKKKKKI